MDSGDCHYVSGDVIEINDVQELNKIKNANCIIEEGVILRLYYKDENKTNGAQEEIILNQKETLTMEPTELEQTQEQQEAATETEAAPVQQQTHSTVGEPNAAPFDISQVVSSGGDNTTTIVLAIIAVVGGTAGWKFWQKFSEQKHEQKMKELEIQSQSQGLNGSQPPPCQAANAALEAKITALETKLTSIEKKTSSFSAGFDAEDLEQRLIKVEKKLKGTVGRPPKGS